MDKFGRMNTEQAIVRLTEVIRRKHLALNPEQGYRAWLKRYCDHAKQLPAHLPSEQKVEQFLTALAKHWYRRQHPKSSPNQRVRI